MISSNHLVYPNPLATVFALGIRHRIQLSKTKQNKERKKRGGGKKNRGKTFLGGWVRYFILYQKEIRNPSPPTRLRLAFVSVKKTNVRNK